MELSPKILLQRIFIPRLDETSIFIIGVSFLLLLVTDSELQHDLLDIYARHISTDWRGYVLALMLGLGLFFSIFTFFFRKRSVFEKETILSFVVIVNAVAGFIAGVHGLDQHPQGLFLIIPAWNIFSAAVLMLVWRLDILNINDIVDEKTGTYLGAGICLAVIALTYYVAKLKWHLHWSAAFSACVFYATSLNLLILRYTDVRIRKRLAEMKLQKQQALENSLQEKITRYKTAQTPKDDA